MYDYSDQPGHRGVSGSGYGFDEALMADAMRAGFQIAIHAIGDAGNREALEHSWKSVFPKRPGNAWICAIGSSTLRCCIRTTCLGLVSWASLPRWSRLMRWRTRPGRRQRLGPQRVLGAYAWRSLREADARLTFNSDNPGSDHNIFYGLHSAITRQDKNSQPEGGWYVHESMNADEGDTRLHELVGVRELSARTIPVSSTLGRWADLTVMDVDPFVLADEVPADMLQGRILMTDG